MGKRRGRIHLGNRSHRWNQSLNYRGAPVHHPDRPSPQGRAGFGSHPSAIAANQVHWRQQDLSSQRSTASLGEATLVSSSVLTAEKYQDGARFNALMRQVKLYRTWADGYGYLLLASGKLDIAVDPIVNPWDVFPVIPVARGAGARVANWQGNTDHWKSCVAAAPGLFDQVIAALNSDISLPNE